jgi:pimeloyl-ACP methyl ester carboxylesterase
MKRKLKIAAIVVVSLGLLFVITIVGMFFRPDLTREQLSEYVNDESKFIELPSGANAHYRDEGNPDGPVVVLLHGGYGSLHNWDLWMDELKKNYRVVRMDLPASGLTGRIPGDLYTRGPVVSFVQELLTALEVDRFALGGHSWGGGIALEYTLAHPDQVEGLILLGSEGVPPDEGYDAGGVFTSELDQSDTTAPEDVEISIGGRIFSKFSSPWLVGETLKAIMENDNMITPEFARQFDRIIRHDGNRHAMMLAFRQQIALLNDPKDLEPRLPEIKVPVLIQIGRQDSLVPPEVGEKFHAGLSDSELKIYENCGHMIQWEVEDESIQDLLAFLKDRVWTSGDSRTDTAGGLISE